MTSEGQTPERTKRLGRGLGALIGSAVPARAADETASAAAPIDHGLVEIPVKEIRPNPMQPRRDFAPEDLAELSASMQVSGLLQPITVRRTANGFELITGERRLRAARSLGWVTIPAIVRDVPEDQLLLLALVENLQRADLNPIDEAEGFRRLGSDFGLTQQQIADAVGKDRSTVSNALRLLALPPEVQQLVRSNALSSGHARALLALPGSASISEIAHQVIEQQLSVRQVEALAASRREEAAVQPPRTRRRQQTAEVRQIRDQLRRALQTDVDIVVGPDDRGELRIRFYSAEDLERLLELMTRSTPSR